MLNRIINILLGLFLVIAISALALAQDSYEFYDEYGIPQGSARETPSIFGDTYRFYDEYGIPQGSMRETPSLFGD